MTSRRRTFPGLRILAIAALFAVVALAASLPGLRQPAPVLAADGGCSPASSTCYLFDVHLGTGPGLGTGFGTYRTMGEDGTYTGRINCRYGNETQSGACGWGYESQGEGSQVDIFYLVSPDPGSKACDSVQCYTDDFIASAPVIITGNYAEQEWQFLLIQAFQIDAVVSGAGSGSVTSIPPGIDCPDDCDDLFAANLPVTLTATPAAGSVFARWEGEACTGTDPTCVITTDFLQTVTAVFNRKTTPPPPTKTPTKPPVTEAPETDEPTEDPTDEATAEPTLSGTESETPSEGPLATALEATPAGSDPAPGTTAEPSPAPVAAGGNVPLIAGLVALLVVLVGGALFFARRGRAAAG